MIGITMAAFGLVPRLAVAGWALLVTFLLIGELGPIFELNRHVMDISPFVHVPLLGRFSATPMIWLIAVAAVLIALGVEGFRHRDLD
jgi:ABC-2 type transport system permease protein